MVFVQFFFGDDVQMLMPAWSRTARKEVKKKVRINTIQVKCMMASSCFVRAHAILCSDHSGAYQNVGRLFSQQNMDLGAI